MQNAKSANVFLVGAGPGDPGLLTVRGAELLKTADIVIYDYLSNPQLLLHCPSAEAIYVGKKAAEHSMTQEQINALLVEKGLTGKRVVRLKGGDPFVFGRGGEECEAPRLRESFLRLCPASARDRGTRLCRDSCDPSRSQFQFHVRHRS